VLSLIGCTGPPALPGIPRTRRARLLEWDRWVNCWWLPARPPPVGNGGGDPTRTPSGHRWPGGPEPGGARRPAASYRSSQRCSRPPLHHVLGAATSCGEVAGRLIRSPPPRSSSAATLGPRGAGVGAAVRARAGYVGGHPGTTRSLTLAGVGQCSLADGLGRQTGRSRSAGSSARVATGGPGGRSVGAGRAGGCR
jgi:hypothetical protein